MDPSKGTKRKIRGIKDDIVNDDEDVSRLRNLGFLSSPVVYRSYLVGLLIKLFLKKIRYSLSCIKVYPQKFFLGNVDFVLRVIIYHTSSIFIKSL